MYADKFHSKRTPPVFLTGDTYAAAVGRWGADKVTAFASLRAKYGEPVLGAAQRHHWIRRHLTAFSGRARAKGRCRR